MFSPNMLKTFQSCPQKYWLKYIQKISMPQKNSMFEKGKKVHALAHYYLRGDDISKLETALTADERQIWENLKQNEFFQKSYVNSEYNLSCKVGDYWIGGRLDALMKEKQCYYKEAFVQHGNLINNEIATDVLHPRNDIYYILDYKTGQIPKNPEFDFQTMVYLLCAYKKFKQNLKFVYIDLKNNQNCIIDFSLEKATEYEKRIIEICQKIKTIQPQEDNEYSKQCEFCEYRKLCFFN